MSRRDEVIVKKRTGKDVALSVDTGLEKRLTPEQLKNWRTTDRQTMIDYLEQNQRVREHRFRKKPPKGAKRVLEGTVVDAYLLQQMNYTNYADIYILYLIPREGI